jgi:outer membrane protein TolC
MNLKIFLSLIAVGATALTAGAETLTLGVDECRERALTSSEDVQIASIESLESGLNLDVAKRSYLPTVDATAMGIYMFPDMDIADMMTLQMHGAYLAGLSLMQPIYTGGKLTAGKNLAKVGVEVSAEKERQTKAQTVADVDKSYWTLVAVDSKIRMLKSYMVQLDSVYAQTERAMTAGMITRNDLLRVEARRSEVAYNLKKAENGRDICRMALCRQIGVDADTEISPADHEVNVTEPTMMSSDFSNRPELRMLQLAIDAKEQQVKMAKADYLPKIGFGLSYSRYGNIKAVMPYQLPDGSYTEVSQTTNKGIGMAMLSVQIPILNWGITGKKVKKAKYDQNVAELTLEKNRRLLDLEVRQAINNVNDGYELVLSARIALDQAWENLCNMDARYKVSMCQLIDLLDAQSQWTTAQSNLIEASAQYRIYQTDYLRATGNLF